MIRRLLLSLLLLPAFAFAGTITPTRQGSLEPETTFGGDAVAFTWSTLTTTNATGVPASYSAYGDRTVQISGTWGSGGTAVLEGSLDGVTYFTLTDFTGAAISLSADGLRSVSEAVLYVRPAVTAGDGTTSLTAVVFMRGK